MMVEVTIRSHKCRKLIKGYDCDNDTQITRHIIIIIYYVFQDTLLIRNNNNFYSVLLVLIVVVLIMRFQVKFTNTSPCNPSGIFFRRALVSERTKSGILSLLLLRTHRAAS